MCFRDERRMMRPCQSERHRDPEDRTPSRSPERSPTMTTLTITVTFARHLLTSLATIAFGLTGN
jgi:hypothetical protein